MVSGRGEFHLAILVEKMRREGYEFQAEMRAKAEDERDEQARLASYWEAEAKRYAANSDYWRGQVIPGTKPTLPSQSTSPSGAERQ